MVNNKDGMSQRKLAGCFKCRQSYVNRVIKSIGIQNIRNERFQTEPNNKRKSIERSVQRFTVNTEIENGFWTMRVIFTKTHSTINGNKYLYSDNIDFTPANVKFRRKHKYEKK